MDIRSILTPRHARWLSTATLTLIVGTLLLPGCGTPKQTQRGSFVRLVDVDGPRFTARSLPAVNVENPNGTVSVVVQPGLRDAVVEATDRSGDKAFDPEDPRAEILATKRLRQNRMELRVRRRSLDDENRPIDITVRVPSCGGVHIVNAGGDVSVTGLTGDVSIASGREALPGGDISIRTDLPLDGPVDITTISGDIDVRTGPGTEGRFSVGTNAGEVVVDIRGSSVTNARPEDQLWTGQVGDASHDVKIRSLSGDVRVHVGR